MLKHCDQRRQIKKEQKYLQAAKDNERLTVGIERGPRD